MNLKYSATILIVLALLFQNCSSIKVLDAWKADQNTIESFKEKNILVIARTANYNARVEFEEEIAKQLRSKGFTAKESFWKVRELHPEREMTEKRMNLIKTLLDSEGYTGIVVTTIKDKKEITRISSNGIYMGATYGNYYPGFYGGFNNYYSNPYASGYYYGGFGGYIPVSTSTSTSATYVLETLAYNLEAPEENQLVSVVTTQIKNPNDAANTAAEFVKKIMKSLEN